MIKSPRDFLNIRFTGNHKFQRPFIQGRPIPILYCYAIASSLSETTKINRQI